MTPLISFRVTVSFIYPLKAPGILWFFDVFRGIERYQWHGMYLVGINAIYFRDRFLIFGSIQNTTNLLNEEYLGQSPRNLSDSQTSNIHDQRQGLIKLVKDIFDKEQHALIAEINTLSEYRNERLPVNEDMLQKQVCGIHLEYIF